MSLLPQKKEYTYEEWLELDNNEDTELIDGIVYYMWDRTQNGMNSGPSRRHMDVQRELVLAIGKCLETKKCRLYFQPFVVKLSKKTTVRPDIAVICDESKLNDRGCVGAPDLIIEILSLSNATNDMWVKYNYYLMASVKEYWIVDPTKNEVTVYILKDGKYHGTWYSEKDILPVTTLPGCEIDLSVIFAK